MTRIATLAGVSVGDGFPVRLMAAINVSPESFYSGSVQTEERNLGDAAEHAAAAGADIIDIGARSTAPYRDTQIALDEEVRRISWAVRVVNSVVKRPICVDTMRAPVAEAALSAGARIINDVSGLRADAAMADVSARADGLVLMAWPDISIARTAPLPQVRHLLTGSIERARRANIPLDRIVVDPGIGFFTQSGTEPTLFNCVILNQLRELEDLGRPILVGVSRKSFIGELTGRTDPEERLAGSLGATAVAVYNGAAVIRTHDVSATRDVVRVAEAIRSAAVASFDL